MILIKVYVKILSIAVAIQLVGLALTCVLGFVLPTFVSQSTIAPVFVFAAFLVSSMVLALLLALKWCKTKKIALVTYILLPTNYTWLILAILVVRFVAVIVDILSSIPSNFG